MINSFAAAQVVNACFGCKPGFSGCSFFNTAQLAGPEKEAGNGCNQVTASMVIPFPMFMFMPFGFAVSGWFFSPFR